MKAVIVGAGAVGQVYGRHLQLGGAEVRFLVKPDKLEEARRGFALYPLNRRKARRAAIHFDAPVTASIEEAMEWRPDAVLLCVSSAALRVGDWLGELCERLGDASVVALQPAPKDLDLVAKKADRAQIVAGLIGIVSYAGPLPGEELPAPGTVYWFPPLSRSAFSGDSARTTPLLDAFRAGGLPAKLESDVATLQGFGSSLLLPIVIGLEIAGWSFRDMRRDRALTRLVKDASRETMAVVSQRQGVPPPLPLRLARPLSLTLGLPMGKWAAPLDLETYFRVHFTKVKDQTRLWIEDTRALAASEGVSDRALAELSGGTGSPR